MKRVIPLLAVVASLLFSATASAQGVLVVVNQDRAIPLPRPVFRPTPPPVSYKIKAIDVSARITDQIARTQVSQTFVNTGSRQMEVSFVFPLPYDGAVDQLTFMVDGKEYEAKLLPAKEARSIYEGYVRRNQDPALLEWIGTGMFKTSVFPIPPGAERTVSLRYSQLLRKDHDLTDFLFPLSTAKYTSHAVEKVSLRASIESTAPLKSVYSPTHSIDVGRSDDHHAVVKYEAANQVPTSDFRLFFDTASGELGASVLSYRPVPNEDGYFLLLTSPEIKAENAERPKKTAIFVVDRSGSMSGKKMDQAREALKFVLNNLREGDLFNVIAYDSVVEAFKPELQGYNEETRKAAIGWVEGLYAGGSTNIDGALTAALKMIQDDSRPNFVVFMTDGLPTAGETNEAKIAEHIRQENKHGVRIVSFGVGYDLNSRLLDRLSADNHGQSEFVRPNEDIEAHVSRLYQKISSPVLNNVAVNVEFDEAKIEEGRPVNRVYPRTMRDLFEGEQLVVVGRYKKTGVAKITVQGQVGAAKRSYDFPAEFTSHSGDQTYAFVEKLWAMRRIGEIIDEIDLSGENNELVTELVSLSTKHGIITPYTSFLADDLAHATPAGEEAELARRAVLRLREADGRAGFAQRDEKKQLKEATLAPQASGFGGGGAKGDSSDELADLAGAAPGAPPANKPGLGGPAVTFRDIDADREVAADGVQVIGNETLYRQGKIWFDAASRNLDLSKAKVTVIKRFSDEYFQLTAANNASENAMLARQQPDQEFVVQLRGVTYHIK